MRPLLNETKNKILSTLIVTLGAFLGFEAVSIALGIYQLSHSFYLSLYIYLFHVVWLTFIFDLHLKKRGVWANNLKQALKDRFEHILNWSYFRHYQNYLVLPGIIYWGTVILLLLNPFDDGFKQILIVCSTLALSVSYWYMKEHVSKRLEHEDHWIRTLSLVKLYAAFIIFSSTMAVTFYFGFDAIFVFGAVFALTFLLIYQALYQHQLLNFYIFLWIVIIALTLSVVSLWVYSNWSNEYLTAGLVLLAVYNTMWGILHHHLDHTLTKKIAFEYVAMMVFVVTFLVAGHNFDQRVI